MAREAARLALADAGIDYREVQQAYAGFVYGDSTAGQHALYALGMTGIPIVNVNNNCSTGSTALFLARQAIEGGAADCVLALGFEQMNPGAIGAVFRDRPSPFSRFDAVCDELAADAADVPLALRYFGGAGREHMQRYGTKLSTFAKIRAKASRHAEHNPLAIFRKVVTEDEVLADAPLWPGVMTRMMACPPTCGAAAAVLMSEARAKRARAARGVRIRAQAMTTDSPATFDARSMMQLVGYGMARDAARSVYEAAGDRPAGHRRLRAARLLRAQRADQLRGARLLRRGRSGGVRRARRQYLRRARSSPILRAACCRRAIRSERPDSRNATNWCSSCAAPRARARYRAQDSRSSTTSVSAALASSRCTRARSSYNRASEQEEP